MWRERASPHLLATRPVTCLFWNAHPSNYSDLKWSELVLHWVMKQVIQAKGDFVAGFHNAITMTVSNQNGVVNLHDALKAPARNSLNLVIFDGDLLWVYPKHPAQRPGLERFLQGLREVYRGQDPGDRAGWQASEAILSRPHFVKRGSNRVS